MRRRAAASKGLGLKTRPIQTWQAMLSAIPQLVTSGSIAGSVALLGFASLRDIATRTVPNWTAAALSLLGFAARVSDSTVFPALLGSTTVFIAALFCWHRGWLGGGDVKLLGGTAMTVPPFALPTLVSYIALAGGGIAVLYLAARRLVPRTCTALPRTSVGRVLRVECWRIKRKGPLPYACAIAIGATLVFCGWGVS